MGIGTRIAKSVLKSTVVAAKPDHVSGEVKRLSNFYTGKKLNPAWVAGIGGASILGSNMKHGFEQGASMPLQLATQRDMQYYGAPDIMMYDGVGQQRAPVDMNASGSIVFGLHNMRRG